MRVSQRLISFCFRLRPQHPSRCHPRRSLHYGAAASPMLSLFDELAARGMISQTTDATAIAKSLSTHRTVYLGIDPTAHSLHVGHLLPLMCLLHFHLRGHTAIPLIGGGTGLVGDPSGKNTERTPLGATRTQGNIASLKHATEHFFVSATSYASQRIDSLIYDASTRTPPKIANNAEWLSGLGLLEFLSAAGRHARVPTMLARDSVKLRLASPAGISFAELTYQLLQAYDFLYLYRAHGCTIQIGGSDQWGNILAGVDLIDRSRRLVQDTDTGQSASHSETEESIAHGITTPLLTTASGVKFGKSEGNAIWLDEKWTSVFDLYQFFLRTADLDVGRYLRMFTLLPLPQIQSAVREHEGSPEKRTAQRLLADEVVELVHGKDGVRRAHLATSVLFSPPSSRMQQQLRAADIISALDGDPRLVRVLRTEALDQSIWRLARRHGLAFSNAEAHRLADARGLYLNNAPVGSKRTLKVEDLLDGAVAVLRVGKDNHVVLALE